MATVGIETIAVGDWIIFSDAGVLKKITLANLTSFVAIKKWTFKETSWAPALLLKQWSESRIARLKTGAQP